MNAKEKAQEHINVIAEMLVEMEHALDCERHLLASKAGYNWADTGDVAEVRQQLSRVMAFWNGGDTDA